MTRGPEVTQCPAGPKTDRSQPRPRRNPEGSLGAQDVRVTEGVLERTTKEEEPTGAMGGVPHLTTHYAQVHQRCHYLQMAEGHPFGPGRYMVTPMDQEGGSFELEVSCRRLSTVEAACVGRCEGRPAEEKCNACFLAGLKLSDLKL